MERLKAICVKCFRLHWALALLLSAAFGGGLVWIFLNGMDTRWYACIVYVGAFYVLAADCVLLIPWAVGMAKERRAAGPKTGTAAAQKFRRSLYAHLLVDLGYGLWQIGQGALAGSAWIGGYGIYNVCHGVLRAVLARYERRIKELPEGRKKQALAWRCYTVCGFLMVSVNLTMTGLVFQMIWMGRSSSYSEIMVIAVAAFTFYKLTMAIIRVVRCRRSNEPISGAARNLGLAEAMMSLFSLQVALFAVYGGEFEQQLLMNSLTGFVVCLLTMLGGIGMIFHGFRRTRLAEKGECYGTE